MAIDDPGNAEDADAVDGGKDFISGHRRVQQPAAVAVNWEGQEVLATGAFATEINL